MHRKAGSAMEEQEARAGLSEVGGRSSWPESFNLQDLLKMRHGGGVSSPWFGRVSIGFSSPFLWHTMDSLVHGCGVWEGGIWIELLETSISRIFIQPS
jgi:hypothetical protein